MTIYYYPNPAAKPASTNKQYVLGDYYVDNTPYAWILATSIAGNTWQKTALGGPTVPTLVPSMTTNTLVLSTTGTQNSAINFTPVNAIGGAATASGLDLSVSPALPNGLNLTVKKSTVQITGTDGVVRLFNSTSVTVSGTPTVAGH